MRVFVAIFILILFGNMNILPLNAQDCLATRLEIGGEARVTPGAANRIRSHANASSEQVGQIPAGEVISILDGADCVDGFLWWRINYNGIEGWTVEASTTDYFLESYSDESVDIVTNPVNCPLETRLEVDGYGQVSSTVPSRLRNEPDTTGEQVGQVDPIDIFQVIEGPICANGFNWWQVRVSDLVGWLAEGTGDTYFVEVVTDPAIIDSISTPEPPVISYSASWNSDGSRVAIATENGVLIYHTDDWTLEPYLLDNGVRATDLAFSPTNPNLLVINNTDFLFRFRVYRLSDDNEALLFEQAIAEVPSGPTVSARDFAFSADGHSLGLGGTPYSIFDTETWTTSNRVEINEIAGNHIVFVIISPSDLSYTGQTGAGITDSKIVNLLDLTLNPPENFGDIDPRISTLDRGGRTQDIQALEFSPDGMQLIIGDNTGSLQMWDLATGTRTSFIRAEGQRSSSNQINDIAFHPDGDTVASAESDPIGIIRIFDTNDLNPLIIFGTEEAHTVANIVSYSPDGTLLLAVMDNIIYVLDTTDYSVIYQGSIWTP